MIVRRWNDNKNLKRQEKITSAMEKVNDNKTSNDGKLNKLEKLIKVKTKLIEGSNNRFLLRKRDGK